MTALIGTAAQFHCAATGYILTWLVDGLLHDNPTIIARGVSVVTRPGVSGSIQSNLTVPATLENNGTSVQCAITSLTSVPALSDPATLRVLPGVCSLSCIQMCLLCYVCT